MWVSPDTQNAENACKDRLYRHIRTFEKLVKNHIRVFTKNKYIILIYAFTTKNIFLLNFIELLVFKTYYVFISKINRFKRFRKEELTKKNLTEVLLIAWENSERRTWWKAKVR